MKLDHPQNESVPATTLQPQVRRLHIYKTLQKQNIATTTQVSPNNKYPWLNGATTSLQGALFNS